MAFTLPQFPLAVNIWRATSDIGAGDPPDVIADANLVFPKRAVAFQPTQWDGLTVVANWMTDIPCMSLLLPSGTDIRYGWNPGASDPDIVEIPAASGRAYIVLYVDTVAMGFANEHLHALVVRATGPWLALWNTPANCPLPTGI